MEIFWERIFMLSSNGNLTRFAFLDFFPFFPFWSLAQKFFSLSPLLLSSQEKICFAFPFFRISFHEVKWVFKSCRLCWFWSLHKLSVLLHWLYSVLGHIPSPWADYWLLDSRSTSPWERSVKISPQRLENLSLRWPLVGILVWSWLASQVHPISTKR